MKGDKGSEKAGKKEGRKKRKAPRYWSEEPKDELTKKETEKSEAREDVEEITIDPETLNKYNRGERINVKVQCFINLVMQKELLKLIISGLLK